MSDSNVTIPSLSELVQQFCDWGAHNGCKGYPDALWETAIHHAKNSSIKQVAQAIGVCRYYLRGKIEKAQAKSPTPFVEVVLP